LSKKFRVFRHLKLPSILEAVGGVWGPGFVRTDRMAVSVFDLFKVGIGPSRSHTVGPMWAALRFVWALEARGALAQVRRVRADLYGSLALTGRGHATDKAVLLGLSGEQPDTVDPEAVEPLVDQARSQHTLRLAGRPGAPGLQHDVGPAGNPSWRRGLGPPTVVHPNVRRSKV
jgi:hypothetical protein